MAVPERFLGITGGERRHRTTVGRRSRRPPQLRFRHGDRQHGLVAAFGHDAIDGQIRAEAGDFGVHRARPDGPDGNRTGDMTRPLPAAFDFDSAR